MKKNMNQPACFVDESLKGILLAHADFYACAQGDLHAVFRKQKKSGRVSIVTGGGYGHLPLFLGYVGEGLCDGVAVGNVFTSPSFDTIVNVTRAVENSAGVLYLFGHYFGDTMNFEMAAETVAEEGIPTHIFTAADDIASAPREERNERRGIAGIFFCYKVAGACADTMAPLEEVVRVVEKAAERISSFGVAFSSCTLPDAGKPIFEIDDQDMEIGMGIHGETGIERGKMISSAELAEKLMEPLLKDASLQSGDRVAVLVNGLGATSREELYILFGDLADRFAAKNIQIARSYVGEYVTSMEMAGLSVSVLRLDDELECLLAAPAYTPFFCIY